MASWKEMALWLLEYNNYDLLKASEISRMWTQIVHVRPPRRPAAATLCVCDVLA